MDIRLRFRGVNIGRGTLLSPQIRDHQWDMRLTATGGRGAGDIVEGVQLPVATIRVAASAPDAE
jgi:hypothetical protein